jgi:hypothetical protein
VRTQTREVAAFGFGCLMKGIANSRIPERSPGRPLLLKNERIRTRAIFGQLRSVALN